MLLPLMFLASCLARLILLILITVVMMRLRVRAAVYPFLQSRHQVVERHKRGIEKKHAAPYYFLASSLCDRTEMDTRQFDSSLPN